MASLLRSVQFGIWLYTLIVVIARLILIESVFPCLAEGVHVPADVEHTLL